MSSRVSVGPGRRPRGALRGDVEAMIERAGQRGRVRLWGFRRDVENFYAAADVYALGVMLFQALTDQLAPGGHQQFAVAVPGRFAAA